MRNVLKRKRSVHVITVNDCIQKRSGNHSHAGDAAEVNAAKPMEKVKEHPINSQGTPYYIVSVAHGGKCCCSGEAPFAIKYEKNHTY